MKKNRLGTLLTVLCPPAAASACESMLFRETTTLGIRQTQQRRTVLAREMVTVTTPYGQVPIKVARAQLGGAVLNLHPEYEDCAELARSHKFPGDRCIRPQWQQRLTGSETGRAAEKKGLERCSSSVRETAPSS